MKNNNGAVIKKITRASLKADRKRNFFVAAAILITAFMIASVFSFGLSSLKTIEKQRLVSAGTAAHGFITFPTKEQAEKIVGLDYVKTGAKVRSLGTVVDSQGELRLVMMSMESSGWESMYAPTEEDITGGYPQKENEVMCPTWFLEELGIEEPKVGMKISLSYRLDMTDLDSQVQEDTFILSGFYKGYGSIGAYATDVLFTSDAFADKNGLSFEKCGSLMFRFGDASRIAEDYGRLTEALEPTEGQRMKLNTIVNNGEEENVTFLLLILVSIFFMFTGYLLIYNVMNISVSRDIRFFGMLKTIGTTPKQIRRIVRGQVLRLCMIGIPAGLVLAAAFSFVLVPVFLSGLGREGGVEISFSPIIYVGAVLLSLVTALIGGMRPARSAARISPVEALRYSGVGAVSGRAHSPARVKPWRMALRNIFREKKRAFLVLLSLFLSVAAFMMTSTVTSSLNVDDWIATYMPNDFMLGNGTVSVYSQSEPIDVFNQELLDEISRLEGVESMEVTSYGESSFENTGEVNACVREAAKNSEIMQGEEGIDEYISQAVLGTMMAGVDAETLKKLLNGEDFDAEGFEKGEFVLLRSENSVYYKGLKHITVVNGDQKQQLSVGGIAPEELSLSIGSVTPIIVCSNSVITRYAPNALVQSVDINAKPGFEEQLLEQLQALKSDNIYMNSRIEEAERLQGTKITIFVLGGGISLILGLIGIMNLVNVMSVGIITRKHELAVLESVGMLKRQAKRMLVFEGLWYAVFTVGLSLSFGSLLSYGVFMLLKAQTDFLAFTYPAFPVAAAAIIIIVICALVPARVYKGMSKAALVDRLRIEY